MDLALVLELAIFTALMGLSAFFSSSETSLFSLDQRQLEQMRRAKRTANRADRDGCCPNPANSSSPS